MKKIAVFDFDGTIIKQDSMVLFFFRYFKFGPKTLPQFLKILFGAAKYFLKVESQLSFKQKYVSAVLKNSKIKDIEALAEDFSDYLITMVFPESLRWMDKLRKKDYELVLMSASIDTYLEKVYTRLGFDRLICTKVLNHGGKAVIEKNCYGVNKIEMLMKHYNKKDIDWQSSYCFDDGPSDKALLEMFGFAYIINNRRFYSKNPHLKFLKWD